MEEEEETIKVCTYDCRFLNNVPNYNGENCNCIKCPNFILCRYLHPVRRGSWGSPGQLCYKCYYAFNIKLDFVSSVDCGVCLDSNVPGCKHPSGCGHSFCLGCTRELFWPQTVITYTAEDYGLPERECGCRDWKTCDECIDMFDEWQNEDEGLRWNMRHIEDENTVPDRVTKKCPFCRKERDPFEHLY